MTKYKTVNTCGQFNFEDLFTSYLCTHLHGPQQMLPFYWHAWHSCITSNYTKWSLVDKLLQPWWRLFVHPLLQAYQFLWSIVLQRHQSKLLNRSEIIYERGIKTIHEYNLCSVHWVLNWRWSTNTAIFDKNQQVRSCVKMEVAVLGSPPLIVSTVGCKVTLNLKKNKNKHKSEGGGGGGGG